MTRTEIGAILEKERKKLGLNYQTASYKAEITPAQIKAIDKSKTNYTIDSLIKYADSLGYEIIAKKK